MNKIEKISIDERIKNTSGMYDAEALMLVLAQDYFAALTYMIGDKAYVNYYNDVIKPMEKAKGHLMDLIEVVEYFVLESRFPDNFINLEGRERFIAEKKVRNGEINLYKIFAEPLGRILKQNHRFDKECRKPVTTVLFRKEV